MDFRNEAVCRKDDPGCQFGSDGLNGKKEGLAGILFNMLILFTYKDKRPADSRLWCINPFFDLNYNLRWLPSYEQIVNNGKSRESFPFLPNFRNRSPGWGRRRRVNTGGHTEKSKMWDVGFRPCICRNLQARVFPGIPPIFSPLRSCRSSRPCRRFATTFRLPCRR